jgi:hypothetical protein
MDPEEDAQSIYCTITVFTSNGKTGDGQIVSVEALDSYELYDVSSVIAYDKDIPQYLISDDTIDIRMLAYAAGTTDNDPLEDVNIEMSYYAYDCGDSINGVTDSDGIFEITLPEMVDNLPYEVKVSFIKSGYLDYEKIIKIGGIVNADFLMFYVVMITDDDNSL